MAQLEYGDYYKFVVSCGIGLIVVSVGLPWLFLREPFDLLVETSKLKALTPLARDVVLNRQQVVGHILTFVPWASAGFGISGIVLTLYGLVNWRKRQTLRDETEDVALRKNKLELEQMTPAEVMAEVRSEVAREQAESVAVAPPIGGESVDLDVADYIASENELLNALADRLPAGYELLRHQRSGISTIDGLLRPRAGGGPEYLIEIKRLSNRANDGHRLREALKQIAQVTAWANLGKATTLIPMVIAVTADIDLQLIETATGLIRDTNENPTAFGRSLIRLVSRNRLKILSARDIDALLDTSQRLLAFGDGEAPTSH